MYPGCSSNCSCLAATATAIVTLRAHMRSRGNVIGVGTRICVQKNLNAALSAGSPPERLVEALSQTLQTKDSTEELRGAFYT